MPATSHVPAVAAAAAPAAMVPAPGVDGRAAADAARKAALAERRFMKKVSQVQKAREVRASSERDFKFRRLNDLMEIQNKQSMTFFSEMKKELEQRQDKALNAYRELLRDTEPALPRFPTRTPRTPSSSRAVDRASALVVALPPPPPPSGGGGSGRVSTSSCSDLHCSSSGSAQAVAVAEVD